MSDRDKYIVRCAEALLARRDHIAELGAENQRLREQRDQIGREFQAAWNEACKFKERRDRLREALKDLLVHYKLMYDRCLDWPGDFPSGAAAYYHEAMERAEALQQEGRGDE